MKGHNFMINEIDKKVETVTLSHYYDKVKIDKSIYLYVFYEFLYDLSKHFLSLCV